ncbi:hypothetical protein GCM10018785_46850 [Streptomyces longispororuber]|uniref:Uncharacterized protein n=1 Tax=Streptomyces longispororuber TaxID=68230 RepID=A0A919DRU8_9ACTN|nr:hypothetical protein GCM10018785_46850 [Streptomyces longispororuber]
MTLLGEGVVLPPCAHAMRRAFPAPAAPRQAGGGRALPPQVAEFRRFPGKTEAFRKLAPLVGNQADDRYSPVP